MVLVNGAEGIGTGWSTFVPNYNPRDVVENLKLMLQGREPRPLAPWYKGFRGTMEETTSKTAGKSYVVNGIISEVGQSHKTNV